MESTLYQIDAFTNRLFAGNPAAVCPLKKWLPDATMQAIALENNLSETAFFVPENDEFAIRWFTPVTEVNLCGHATLASAYVIFNYLQPERKTVTFHSASGPLHIKKSKKQLRMDFPALPVTPCNIPQPMLDGLNIKPTAACASKDYLAIFESEEQIRALKPNFKILSQLDRRGLIVTAPGDKVDFVSRFFVPNAGVSEDPVTGSAHCALTPYWAKRLNKTKFKARQLSQRGGELRCELHGNRVYLFGNAVPYLIGKINIDVNSTA